MLYLGAIVNFAPVELTEDTKVGGRWNSLTVWAIGGHLMFLINDVVTSTVTDTTYTRGPIALQFGPGIKSAQGGPIKWRSVCVCNITGTTSDEDAGMKLIYDL